MLKFLRFLFLVSVVAAPVFAQRDIGPIEVFADHTIPVRVSGATPELNALALQAFGSHGRYHLVASGYLFDVRFSPAGAGQVRVEVAKGAAAGTSEVVSGPTTRAALLAAADIAVVRTNGLGLRGFFTSRLVFIGERTGHKEVYTSDLFFGDVQQITRDRAIAMTPRWSPDGSRILYTSFYQSGFPDIFEIALANYQRTTFVSFRGTNSGGRFSPDGRQAVMVLSGEGGPEIYVSNAQGRGVSRRTRSDSVKSSPCWSPDGSRLVFSCEPGPQLYIMPASGGSAQRVTYDIGGYSQQASHAPFDGIEPCWLPDGRHVVYTARTSRESRICILDTESGRSIPVSPASLGSVLQANVWSAR